MSIALTGQELIGLALWSVLMVAVVVLFARLWRAQVRRRRYGADEQQERQHDDNR